MTKEELEEKFEDCFDANTHATGGGYEADTTSKTGLWQSFAPIIEEYVKQRSAEFADGVEKSQWKHYSNDNWFNQESNDGPFSLLQLYDLFVKQQSYPPKPNT
jgi:hypothetical protein